MIFFSCSIIIFSSFFFFLFSFSLCFSVFFFLFRLVGDKLDVQYSVRGGRSFILSVHCGDQIFPFLKQNSSARQGTSDQVPQPPLQDLVTLHNLVVSAKHF